MTMSEWAKREVEIACNREAPDRKDGEWDYGCACYESALKAYLCLMDDGHSGYSFGMTRQILNRLMDGKPLTPIDDIPENWDFGYAGCDGSKHYQCRRMSSLFKDIYPDGHVRYSDIDRYYCVDVDSPKIHYQGRGASNILDDLFPITFPYNPPKGKYQITTKDYLTDRSTGGDFDTMEFLQIIAPDGQIVDVNRYFGEVDGKWQELDKASFDKRVEMHREREYMENLTLEENEELGDDENVRRTWNY